MEGLSLLMRDALQNDIIQVVILAIVMDTFFGILRAIKQKKFNSSFGIDGVIRKAAMAVSICFFLVLDAIANINFIGFIPEEARKYIMGGQIGAAEFFGVIYIAYEVVSILKNMALCGLPVKGIWKKVREWLGQYTDELPKETQ